MIKKINVFGSGILTKKAIKITPEVPNIITSKITGEPVKLWSEDVIKHIQDMKDTGEAIGGCVGLSSCQIWDPNDGNGPLAVFIIKMSADGGITHHWQEFINPEIKTSGATVKIREGCVSVPGYAKEMSREANVTIEYNVLNNNQRFSQKLLSTQSGALPFIIQHEYDHLQGKLIKK